MSTTTDEASRPDGLAPSPDLLELRSATRALRLHLDELPIDYDNSLSGDRFLAGLAFMSARQRYDCAESMIGSGFGGTVLGALARGVFLDGLRWRWIAADPNTRRISLLGDLLEERNRICEVLRTTDSSCGNLTRWLMPLPDVADLTGQSQTWFDAPTIPGEPALLDDFLTHPAHAATQAGTRADTLLDLAGLRGAVAVLDHAGHGNFLGLQSTLSEDGAPGHDLRADHEALFMHVAAAGATLTLLGTAAVVPELWPTDIDRDAFLDQAVELAIAVADAARPIHRLTTTKPFTGVPKPAVVTATTRALEPAAVVEVDDLLPDVNTAEDVAAALESHYTLIRGFPVDMWAHGDPTLGTALTFAGAHSNLETVISTYDQPGSEIIAVFAARMLLEEAARLAWRFQDGNQDVFKARATRFFEEYRQKQKKTIGLLTSNGVPKSAAEALFALPSNVVMPTVPPAIRKSREKLPSVSSMLADLGAPFPEPGWLQVAYSLLSQGTHTTPIGLMHNIRWTGQTWNANYISPEMLGLALDVTALSTAVLIGHANLVFTEMSAEAINHRESLQRSALRVHNAGRLVHGLD